jgi:hypothetical protein
MLSSTSTGWIPRGHPIEDEEAIRTRHCRLCDVTLGDSGSMRAHIEGEENTLIIYTT